MTHRQKTIESHANPRVWPTAALCEERAVGGLAKQMQKAAAAGPRNDPGLCLSTLIVVEGYDSVDTLVHIVMGHPQISIQSSAGMVGFFFCCVPGEAKCDKAHRF